MKLLYAALSCLSVLVSLSTNAQTVWNEMPEYPVNPSAGQTDPSSYAYIVEEGGRNYAVYIEYNAGNYELKVQERVASSWNQVYNTVVFSGFENIQPLKAENGESYFVVRTDDSAFQPVFTVYKISNGSVTVENTFYYGDIPDGASYRAAMSQNNANVYLVHGDASQTGLVATKFGLSSSSINSLNIPVGASSTWNYDLVELSDTLFVGVSRAETGLYNNYLHKIPSNFSGVYSYNPANTDAMLGGMAASSLPNGILLNRDVAANIVRVITKDNISGRACDYNLNDGYVYINGSMLHPSQNRQPAAVVYGSNNFMFGPMNDGVGGAYTTDVYYASGASPLQASPAFGFNAVSTSIQSPKLSYSDNRKRLAAEYYDLVTGKNRYYLSNDLPSVQSDGNVLYGCPTVNTLLFQGLKINDTNGDPTAIISISASNTTIFPNGSLTSAVTNQVGQNTFFDIYGQSAASGTTTITIQYTDGYDTLSYTLPSITVNAAVIPTFTQASISICSANNMIDMGQYVQPSGGSFNIAGNTGFFNGMFFNSNASGLTYGVAAPLMYTYSSNGCNISTTATLVVNESPAVIMAIVPTACGSSTGGATATVSGGTLPYSNLLWSSGQTATTSVNNLSQGNYTFTVSDANNCAVITEFTIAPTGVDIVPTITNVSCNGQTNGSISVGLSGFAPPTSLIWSSGHSSTNPTNLAAGTYSLLVQDANNCIYSETFVILQPDQLVAGTSVTAPTCGNADGSMQVSSISGGTAPYDIAWSTGDLTPTVNNVAAGVYSATITDFEGCQTIKTVYLSDANSAIITGSVTGADCGMSNGGIDVTPYLMENEQLQGILWSNGATTEDMLNVPPALYICSLTTVNNCKAFRGWDIPLVSPQQQPICVVSVDSVTSTNLVVWEKVQPVGIAYYNIYRETSNQGEYLLIDTVQATNISLFNDVVASPIVRSWSYKISAVNGCGVEGPLSTQHRTMHLSALDAGSSQTQVSWNAYEGTAYSSFDLWRYTDAANWELIATLPATQTSYVDNTDFATPGLDYMVELQLDEQCSALVYRAQDFNTTRSNKDKGNFIVGQGTGDSNNSIEESLLDAMTIYPSPTTGILFVEQTTNKPLSIRVLDLSGQLILKINPVGLKSELSLEALEAGTYLVEIQLNGVKRTERIIKL